MKKQKEITLEILINKIEDIKIKPECFSAKISNKIVICKLISVKLSVLNIVTS